MLGQHSIIPCSSLTFIQLLEIFLSIGFSGASTSDMVPFIWRMQSTPLGGCRSLSPAAGYEPQCPYISTMIVSKECTLSVCADSSHLVRLLLIQLFSRPSITHTYMAPPERSFPPSEQSLGSFAGYSGMALNFSSIHLIKFL